LPEHIQVIVATAVFLLTYAIIVSEKIHRTIAAFLGAALVVITGIVDPEKAVHAIDFNTSRAAGRYDDYRRHHQADRCL